MNDTRRGQVRVAAAVTACRTAFATAAEVIRLQLQRRAENVKS